MINITTHAKHRIKERCGKSTDRIAGIAFDNGLTVNDTSGSLNRFLTCLSYHSDHGNNIKIYGDKVYIFNCKTLVTVLNLPSHYRNTVNKLMDKRSAL